jgi:uncharacterized small protein (DUF1192 family)
MGPHENKQRCAKMNRDDLPKPKQEHSLGENLEAISLDELNLRVKLLAREIERLQAEITKKQTSRAAADAFFKS